MAFVCSITPESQVEAARFAGNGETLVQIPVGYDGQTGVTFSVLVALSPLPGHFPEGFELTFCVVEADPDDDYITERWDGSETRRAISDPDHRSLVLAAILAGVRTLVEEVRPPLVTMTTYRDNLPDRALTKYHTIASILEEFGYRVGRTDPYHGRHIWMMDRRL